MASPVDTRTDQQRITPALSNLPILYEDDKEADLGEADARRQAEERIRALEAELRRLGGSAADSEDT